MAQTKDSSPEPTKKADAQSSKNDDVMKGLDDAHMDFCRALQEMQMPEDVHARMAEAHLAYLRAVQDAGGDPLRSFEAYLEYVRAQQKAMMPDEVVARATDAYRTYVRAVKDAWGRLDLGDLNPSTLAEMGQRLMTAAMHASNIPMQDRQNAR